MIQKLSDKEEQERLFPMAAKVEDLFNQIKDEDWDVRFLITSVLFHKACHSIGMNVEQMCELIVAIDERENRKKITQ
jgi:hypothetical protein